MTKQNTRLEFIKKIKTFMDVLADISEAGFNDMEGADGNEFIEAEAIYVHCGRASAELAFLYATLSQKKLDHEVTSQTLTDEETKKFLDVLDKDFKEFL